MREARRLLAQPQNDFSWSSWEDRTAALTEIDEHVDALQRGSIPSMAVLFAPTGPIQEVSAGSGWGDEFVRLAERFDHEMTKVTTSQWTGPEPTFRRAVRADLPEIVRLLADDPLGAKREEYVLPLPERYHAAFEVIDRDPNQELVVVELRGKVVGVLQLTYIPYMTYRGSWRALIEGVRIDFSLRSAGIGRKLFAWAVERARDRGCHMLQLTSDKTRPDAIRFYESLGFVASHEGMKLHFPASAKTDRR